MEHYRTIKDKLKVWRRDAVAFVVDCFGVEPSWQQKQLLEAVSEGKYHGHAIRSGHGTGKSAALSWCLLHFLLTRPTAKIVATAPSKRQLKDILWAEVALWRSRALPVIKEMITVQAETIKVQDRGDWFARAVSINNASSPEEQAESLAGYHHEHFLAIVDESSGLNDPVFTPIEGYLTREDNFVIMASNPTKASGYFYRLFNDAAFGEGWNLLHWNSEESPLVDKTWVRRMEKKYGRDSDTYRIRVLGEFPLVGSQELIPMPWIRACVKADLKESDIVVVEGTPCYWGVDVARFGTDESSLAKRIGNLVPYIGGIRKNDTIGVSDWIVEEYHKSVFKPDYIFVDVSGGIGVGVADVLRRKLPEHIIVDVNVSVKAFDDRFFFQARDEMYWRMRKVFEDRTIRIVNDENLIRQLASLRFDQMPGSGKTKIESKKVMRGRGLPSPDRADALALTFFYYDDFVAKKSEAVYRRRRRSWKVA